MSVDLAALRAIVAAATPKPWRASPDPGETCPGCDEYIGDCESVIFGATGGGVANVQVGDYATPDAAVIVALRNSFEAMADELERLRLVAEAARGSYSTKAIIS